tara:strand:- start:6175 stop:6618 length:444 start_codon:yes stop_codon:yes gene_type:complete
MTSKKPMYFCEHCTIEKINGQGQIYLSYFSCVAKHDYLRHIRRKKHTENVERKDEVLCKHCNITFTKEAYELHKQRNQELWRCKQFSSRAKKMTCNHFVCPETGKRYSSWLTFKYETEDMNKINRIIEKQKESEEEDSSGDDSESDD